MNRHRAAVIAAGLALGWVGTAQADPTSQEEVDHQFPLPRAFNPRDVLVARTIAEHAKAVLDEALLDYQTARFKNVRAVFHADWRSRERDYYLCGEMNVRNRMGAYTGWREFVITGQPDKRPCMLAKPVRYS